MKRKNLFLPVMLFVLVGFFSLHQPLIHYFIGEEAVVSEETKNLQETERLKSINNKIEKGETLFSIFSKYGLRTEDLFEMKNASANIHPLRELQPGKPYSFVLDKQNYINSFTYGIDDHTVLKIDRVHGCFQACKYDIPYQTRILTIGGTIQESLIASFGQEREDYLLALQAADILAWDIDFNTDLRKGDTFRIIAEGLYLDGEFKKFGKILSIEFINNNQTYNAYLYERDDKALYYNAQGQSLRKAFLKAPLSFRRISSHFSGSRLHPILKVRRPHHGIDYVAAKGTPVSAVADGTVNFAGYQSGYGKIVIISHHNGYRTYYGHLSRISSEVRKGRKVLQGDLIGYVGATGLATGPHLHFEMRQGGTPMNPVKAKNVAADPVPSTQIAEFRKLVASMDQIFALAVFYDTKDSERKNHYLQTALLSAVSSSGGQQNITVRKN